MSCQSLHLLVLGDSLTFHGPEHAVVPDDVRTHPNVCAAVLGEQLGTRVHVDLVARPGWTARDGWWAVTRDPMVWGSHLVHADGLLLAVGQMDQLPAAIPTWARESIPYLRPARVRHVVRGCYASAAPAVVRATGGPWRQLPQRATDHYLSRIVAAARLYRADSPIVALGPSPWTGSQYPSTRGHDAAVVAARHWAAREHVVLVELDELVYPSLARGDGNPDGLHWSWQVHAELGRATAVALLAAGFGSGVGAGPSDSATGTPQGCSKELG